jgi:hypothetical protein
MKSLLKITFLFSFIFLYSCSGKKLKYKIEGNVMTKKHKSYTYVPNEDTTSYLHPAIAYTDTIHGYNDDSIWYYNSDGSSSTSDIMCVLKKLDNFDFGYFLIT